MMKSYIWKKVNFKEDFYKVNHHNNKKWILSLKKKIIENFKMSKENTIKTKYFIASSPLPIFLLNLKKKRLIF